MNTPCLLTAWSMYERELRGYLRHRMGQIDEADDVLQEVFVKALLQGNRFCTIDNRRAWLFQVARNALADRLRVSREHVPLPHDLVSPNGEAVPAVDDLSRSLPRVLSELSAADRLAITLCDLEGRSQQELADRLHISLAGAKSRVQRARRRLKERMTSACQVRFDENGKVFSFTPRSPL